MQPYSYNGFLSESRGSQGDPTTDPHYSNSLPANVGGQPNSTREIAGLLAHRVTSDGINQYLVEWKPTWEDEAYLLSLEITERSSRVDDPYTSAAALSRMNTPTDQSKRSLSVGGYGDHLGCAASTHQVNRSVYDLE
jgi:hypothetical protein